MSSVLDRLSIHYTEQGIILIPLGYSCQMTTGHNYKRASKLSALLWVQHVRNEASASAFYHTLKVLTTCPSVTTPTSNKDGKQGNTLQISHIMQDCTIDKLIWRCYHYVRRLTRVFLSCARLCLNCSWSLTIRFWNRIHGEWNVAQNHDNYIHLWNIETNIRKQQTRSTKKTLSLTRFSFSFTNSDLVDSKSLRTVICSTGTCIYRKVYKIHIPLYYKPFHHSVSSSRTGAVAFFHSTHSTFFLLLLINVWSVPPLLGVYQMLGLTLLLFLVIQTLTLQRVQTSEMSNT